MTVMFMMWKHRIVSTRPEPDVLQRAREGFAAWQRGDLDSLRAFFDPGVQWRWWEPGEWDCHNREDVMRTLRDRFQEGFHRSELEFVQAAPDRVVVVARPSQVAGADWPAEVATLIRFSGPVVVEMQDYRSRREALEAAALA